MDRAYSLLDIKSIDEESRTLTGLATTPSVDRMGDIVEPDGAEYTLPIPFLWQHDSANPVGSVTKAKVTKAGIEVEIQLQKTDEPGLVKDRLDAAWQDIKLRLVRGLSIGFAPIETARIEGSYGVRFLKWLWLELSGVTVAANGACSIQTIKSIDHQQLAASGLELPPTDRRDPPGVSGKPLKPRVKALEGTKMSKTIAEQISAFQATRLAKSARMGEIMEKAAETGETLDTDQAEEYDGLDGELKSIDAHLGRLNNMEKNNVALAAPVVGLTLKDGSESRGAFPLVKTHKELPKGIGFTRYVIALARAQGNIMQAAEMAKANEQWRAETPDVEAVLKAAVAAGSTTDTTWAGPLVQYQNLTSDFAEYLRPQTIIGRMNLRNVPFKVRIPRQTGASSVNWVGEGKVKPVSALAFDSITMDFAKIAGIVVLTEELIRLSNPAAEGLVRQDLANSIIQFMDGQFVDPSKAANDVSPASITYGVTPITATGTTAAALRADVRALMNTFVDSNVSLADAVWIMTQQQALSISMMLNALGQPDFPGMSVNGGTFAGLPVIASENLPGTGGSPLDGYPLILAKQSEILLADDGQVTVDASREASIQMDSTPDSPATASTVTVSLWQYNMIGVRAERYINWRKRRDEAVGFIQNAKYAE